MEQPITEVKNPETASTQGNEVDKKPETAPIASPEQIEADSLKALLADETARREKAEAKIVKMKRDEEDPMLEVPQDEELEGRLEKRQDDKLAGIVEDLMGDVVENTLEKLSANPDEQRLIRIQYEDVIKKSGVSRKAIIADLNKAKAIVDGLKATRMASELREVIRAEKGLVNSGGSSSKKVEPEKKVKDLPAKDRAFIQGRAQREGISYKEYIIKNHPEYLE